MIRLQHDRQTARRGSTANCRQSQLARRKGLSSTAALCSLAAIIAPATGVHPLSRTTAERELSSLASPTNVFEAWGHSPDDRRLGPASPNSQLDVIFGLVLPPSDLAQLVQAVSQPGNPRYRHYEDVASLAAQTGATNSTSSAVLSALAAYGVTGHLDPSGSYVEAGITVAQASRLFGASFGRYTFSLPSEDGVEVAPDATPQLPAPLRGRVNLVYGLKAVTQASVLPSSSFLTTTPTTLSLLGGNFGGLGSPAGCAQGRTYTGALSGGPMLTPKQYLTAYGVEGLHADGLLGQGQAVAVLSYEPAHQSDLSAFGSCFGLPSPKLDNVRVGATPLAAVANPGWQQEVALDTEMVAAMAPKLSALDVVYGSTASASSFIDLLDAPLNDKLFTGAPPKVVSFSNGICELGGYTPYAQDPGFYALAEHLLMVMAAHGVSFVSAAGDTGSSCNLVDPNPTQVTQARLSVAFPASSPYVTAAGGALFGLRGNDTIENERVWNDSPLGIGAAGGGGQSIVFSRPWYQAGLALPGKGRAVPDVALEADFYAPISVYCTVNCTVHGWQTGAGTSAASPLFAGELALADEAGAQHHEAAVGLANPLIYRLGQAHSTALRRITIGNNDVYGLGCCQAGQGYSEASGWGPRTSRH